MAKAPRKIPAISPIPPRRDVPPTTQAAIAFSSQPSPVREVKQLTLAICIPATKAHKIPTMINAVIFTIWVRIPIALAASALSPVA